jgi:predicted nucleic acid-binding protein
MIILDTNVASELMRPSPAPVVASWVRARRGNELCTTSITLAEIRYGIERLPTGGRRDLLKEIADEVFASFEGQVLPFDAAAATQYPMIVTRRDRAGQPIDGFDAQIASICHTHDAALATRNVKDFQDTGIDVIDPWQTSIVRSRG